MRLGYFAHSVQYKNGEVMMSDLTDEIMNEPIVTINWCPADIVLATGLSDERCVEILEEIEKYLHDRSIELGWEVIDVLVQDYLNEKDQEEEDA